MPAVGVKLFLKASGLSSGKVEILNSGLVGEHARIYITAHYPSRHFDIERKAVVCTLESSIPSQYGVGIFVSFELLSLHAL